MNLLALFVYTIRDVGTLVFLSLIILCVIIGFIWAGVEKILYWWRTR